MRSTMRSMPAGGVGLGMVVGSAPGRTRAHWPRASRTSRDVRETPSLGRCGAASGVGTSSSERPAIGVPRTQRLSLVLRAANPWVIDSLLPPAFLVTVSVTHVGGADSAVRYHGANRVSVLLTTVRVPRGAAGVRANHGDRRDGQPGVDITHGMNVFELLSRHPELEERQSRCAGSHGVRGDTSQVWGGIGLIRGVERSRVAAGRVARFGVSFAAA